MSISLLLLWISSLVLTSLPSLVSAGGSKTCFKRDGTLQQDKNWLPCDPGAKASPCCDAGDFCMSNGLCLDAVGNQWFSAQGTTDSAGSAKYCCGPSDCCKQPNLLSLPIATAVFKPPQTASISGSASSTSASASASVSLLPGPSADDDKNNNNSSSSTSSDNSRTLAIGLGVGIPMGLALLGGVIFLGLQVRKWTAAAQQAKGSTYGGNSIQVVKEEEMPNNILSQQQMYPSELNGHEYQELYSDSRGAPS
ncbi:hypothetical protein PG994_013360 [Apiospora phragmitis]|uniref:Mid2 domain-containing protein n=1 Tax=Apiospora phragmitis TaxID=2905665 RepID=A0ABR1T8Y0_9PEZI